MLIIKKRILFLLMVITFMAVFLTSLSAFLALASMGNKLLAERFLFNGILVSLAIIIVYAIIIIISKNIGKELDNIIENQKISSYSVFTGFNRLGITGEKLQKLFMQREIISDKRKQRIIAKRTLADELSIRIEQPLVVIDLKRKIIHISKGMLNKKNSNRAEIIGKDISIITGRVQLKSILSNLEKKHIPVKITVKNDTYKWIPIYNGENEITYIMVLLSE